MQSSPEELLAACERARLSGADFPTIWTTILRRHKLTLGLPTHRVIAGEAQIVIELSNGRRLLSSVRGFSLG